MRQIWLLALALINVNSKYSNMHVFPSFSNKLNINSKKQFMKLIFEQPQLIDQTKSNKRASSPFTPFVAPSSNSGGTSDQLTHFYLYKSGKFPILIFKNPFFFSLNVRIMFRITALSPYKNLPKFKKSGSFENHKLLSKSLFTKSPPKISDSNKVYGF